MTTRYTISAANRITGKSRTTIAKHLKQGVLSCVDDGYGNKLIDASELIRVYGDACNFEREEGDQTPHVTRTNSSIEQIQHEIKRLEDRLERELVERDRERQNYKEQVEHLKESLAKAQEGHNRATLLLENHNKGRGEWEMVFKSLEERLAKQEEETKKQIELIKSQSIKRIAQYKEKLEIERKRGFWSRVFSV